MLEYTCHSFMLESFAKVSFLSEVQCFWLEFLNKICIISTGVYTRNNEIKWWYGGNNTAFIIHYRIVAKLYVLPGLKNCPNYSKLPGGVTSDI